MRYGFTTGSCAAAAAKAAAYMLLTGNLKENISIITPKGITYDAEITDIVRTESNVSCSVIKDGGDDPDITTGAHICAKVSYQMDDDTYVTCDNHKTFPYRAHTCRINIHGGEGVGTVTKPGLDQPVGEPAINRVPRQMIIKEVSEVCELVDYKGALNITISVPEGEKLADNTFNPRLGIVGGISILGTSGIVEPMSSEALLETIRIELNQAYCMGHKRVVIAPGNYGQEYMKRTFNYDLDKSVKCSNFIGNSIDMAKEIGFEEILLVGHIGKLIKIYDGTMNTHSKISDRRMEIMAAVAEDNGASSDVVRMIKEAVATEEGIRILEQAGISQKVMADIMEQNMKHLCQRAGESVRMECMMYSNAQGMLAMSKGAMELLDLCKAEYVD